MIGAGPFSFHIPNSELRIRPVPDPLQAITFVFGQPVAGNPTQFIVERAFAAAGLDWRYLTLDVPSERLGDAVRGARAMGFQGGNITMPHKVAVIEHLDELTNAAGLIQAVNCIKNDRGRLIGDNTDGRGFLESLRTVTVPAGKRIVVLGAGGAARAIAVELALAGAAEITIVNRSAERGEALAAILRKDIRGPELCAVARRLRRSPGNRRARQRDEHRPVRFLAARAGEARHVAARARRGRRGVQSARYAISARLRGTAAARRSTVWGCS